MFLIPEVYRNSSARALYDAHQRRGWTYRELCDAVQETATLLASRRNLESIVAVAENLPVLSHLARVG